jgi:hypothetical protein
MPSDDPSGLRIVTPSVGGASTTEGPATHCRHPLEDSDRLAWQVSAAVGLLERFGAQLLVALDAVGRGNDPELDAALLERDRLVGQLEPLLAALAEARATVRSWPSPSGAGAGSASHRALALILAPVDDALEHAQHLHRRLSDETRDVLARRGRESALLRHARRGGSLVLVR